MTKAYFRNTCAAWSYTTRRTANFILAT